MMSSTISSFSKFSHFVVLFKSNYKHIGSLHTYLFLLSYSTLFRCLNCPSCTLMFVWPVTHFFNQYFHVFIIDLVSHIASLLSHIYELFILLENVVVWKSHFYYKPSLFYKYDQYWVSLSFKLFITFIHFVF